jgi:rSAM/selenodomain-associated transferase 1
VPPLTHAEAAALSICFLRDTAVNIAAVAAGGEADGVAVYTPRGAERAFNGLLPESFSLLTQRGESFGDRLFHAAEDLLSLGYESLCLIDSDSPTLPRAFLSGAVSELARPGERVVLGPSDDGGYYLIGLKGAHRRLFEDITWSTDRVLDETIERAREVGLEVSQLPPWYDVDDAATLSRLCTELFLPGDKKPDTADSHDGYEATETRGYLASLLEREGKERIWPGGEGTRRGAAL